ncbi:GNAT family N-acetyltransferase [Domibacillus robiginosus]|uniref:GNAT family N-acetyltransferase n=1 Tax=Domibacillus robiginosus TaxID=1071054 RepID=UPI00067E5332|nr:GNAT family N-acetyltransferase [Domibacillus robiginosus]
MWPNKSFEHIMLKGDDDGLRFGVYNKTMLISVVSLFIEGEEAQFRKFATLQEEQGKGYGSQLLNYIIKEAKSRGAKRIWCNARKNKVDFHNKFWFTESGSEFEKNGKEYAIVEKYL